MPCASERVTVADKTVTIQLGNYQFKYLRHRQHADQLRFEL